MWMCTDDMIKCKNNVQCVTTEATCDGNTNCLDGSDEENCANFTCLPVVQSVQTIYSVLRNGRCVLTLFINKNLDKFIRAAFIKIDK